MKIAFDEHIPPAMVKVFQTFANERQLQNLVGGKFEIKSAKDYAPLKSDPDYKPKSDVPWLQRFADDGGKVVISDNRNMRVVPQERLALVELGFIVIFFGSQWSGWRFFRKCSLLLNWWPVIAAKISSKKTKPGSFWQIPSNWTVDGKLHALSNRDQKALKIEEQKRGIGRRKKVTKPPPPVTKPSDGPLFEFANAKTETANATPATEAKDEKSGVETG